MGIVIMANSMPFVSSIYRPRYNLLYQDIQEVEIRANSKRGRVQPEATWRQTRSISFCNYFNIIFSLTIITYCYELTIAFLIGRKRTVNFLNQHLWRHIAADYTIIMSRTLKVTDNHVMYDRNAWFVRVMMSSSPLCVACRQWRSKNMSSIFFSFNI